MRKEVAELILKNRLLKNARSGLRRNHLGTSECRARSSRICERLPPEAAPLSSKRANGSGRGARKIKYPVFGDAYLCEQQQSTPSRPPSQALTVRFLLGCENLTLDTRCRGRLSTPSGPQYGYQASWAHCRHLVGQFRVPSFAGGLWRGIVGDHDEFFMIGFIPGGPKIYTDELGALRMSWGDFPNMLQRWDWRG